MKIEELEKLLSEATPGEWKGRTINGLDENYKPSRFGLVRAEDINVTGVIKPVDADLICTLRNAAPALIEIVRAANARHAPDHRVDSCDLCKALKEFEEVNL